MGPSDAEIRKVYFWGLLTGRFWSLVPYLPQAIAGREYTTKETGRPHKGIENLIATYDPSNNEVRITRQRVGPLPHGLPANETVTSLKSGTVFYDGCRPMIKGVGYVANIPSQEP